MSVKDAGRPGRSAVLFANGLGDHLLVLPALRGLVHVLPESLVLVTGEGPAEILFAGVGLSATIKLPMAVDSERRTFAAAEVASRLGAVERLVSLVPWHSASLRSLIAAVAPAETIGFHPDFDVSLPLDFSKHSADLAFDAVRHFDSRARLEEFTQPVGLPAPAVAFAEHLRRLVGPERRLLVVHNETKMAKRYPSALLEASLTGFLARHPDVFVVALGHRELAFDAAPLRAFGAAAIGLPLESFVAVIAQADLFLGADSFGLHIADLWRVPAVGLFGPTRAEEFGFRYSTRHRHLQGSGTMTDISPAAVVAALDDLALET